MRSAVGKLFVDMTVIIVVAAAAGLVWNYGMLYGVLTGKPGGPAASPRISAADGLPLPAGLMQVREMYDRKEAVFVDARDELSFGRGHIKGAVSFPLGQFEAKSADFTGKVPAGAVLVVYCNGFGCHDSMTLGKKLMSKGYGRVFVYEGGYPEWKDGNLPVEGQNP